MTPDTVIVWTSRIDHSLEVCRLASNGPVWRIEGNAVLVESAHPMSLTYRVDIGRESGYTQFDGRLRGGVAPERRLRVCGGPRDDWRVGATAAEPLNAPELRGACCIDLGWTPLTNTFAIWHLDLPIGGSREITAAWVPFPVLTLEPASQRYTRLSDRHYRYEQPDIGFSAVLEVDERGFVLTYGTIWERVPISSTPPLEG